MVRNKSRNSSSSNSRQRSNSTRRSPQDRDNRRARPEARSAGTRRERQPRASKPPTPPSAASSASGSVIPFPDPNTRPRRSDSSRRRSRPSKRPPHADRAASKLRALPEAPTSTALVPANATSVPSPVEVRSRRPVSIPAVWFLRLAILGVGLGAIVGTVLALVAPGIYLSQESLSTSPVAAETVEPELPEPEPPVLVLGQEVGQLKSKFQALAAQRPQLQPGALFVDLDTGAYVDLGSSTVFSAASTIKVPILVAFFQAVDEGQVRLDEMLTMTPELIGGGAGAMQYQKPGTQYTALYTATKMIEISDNTATNMIIARLGGAEVLNAKFRDWGLENTVIRNPLPDLKGTNTTTPYELVKLMAQIERGKLVSPRSRDRVLDIMYKTVTNTLLPRGLGEGAKIAHKTGDIGSTVGDVGLIDMPSGKRYLAAVLVNRPHNNPQAQELIRAYSGEVYRYFDTQTAPFTE